MTAYQLLEKKFSELANIHGASSILHWDFASMMPNGAANIRSEQLSTLSVLAHNIITDKNVSDLLDEADEDRDSLKEWEQVNLELMRHQWVHSNAVGQDLVEKISKAGSKCEMAWRNAREEDDFDTYLPLQQEVLEITREIATRKSEVLGCSKYDALIDQFDKGMRCEDIDPIFSDLKEFLPDFIEKVIEKQKGKNIIYPTGPFSIEIQKKVGLKLMKCIGFDFNHGRIDTSHHPFCGGVPGDVRITTNYKDDTIIAALMGTLHETGHAMYENGLPKEWHRKPIGDALGMSIHESQSLLVEMQVCRSKGFIHYLESILVEHFPENIESWSKENLFNIYTQVKPGHIRIDADEVTYPLHVIMRYEIEKQLIAGEIEIKDVPEIWNDSAKTLLGIEVNSYKEGCMQDIHWTDGSFGYFPTYTLGAMIAAQLYNAAEKEHPELKGAIKNGDFSILMDWLRENVHNHGSRYDANELVVKATGEKLNPEIYKNHLIERYLES